MLKIKVDGVCLTAGATGEADRAAIDKVASAPMTGN